MNLKEAKEKQLDVEFFPHYSEATRHCHAVGMEAMGRTVEKFDEVIAGVRILCLAIGPRPNHGETAKRTKTSRQFIQEETQ